MGLAWQQGPLSTRSVGRFLTPEPLPGRLLFAEPLRRRMRVRFGGEWIADSEDVDETALTPVDGQTFCPYKGLASYYEGKKVLIAGRAAASPGWPCSRSAPLGRSRSQMAKSSPRATAIPGSRA